MQTSETHEVKLDYTYKYAIDDDGNTGTTVNVPRGTTQSYGVQRSPGLQGWRKIIASGGNATTAMSGSEITLSQSPTFMDHWVQHRSYTPPFGSRRVRLEGNLLLLGWYTSPTLGLADSSASNQALTRYYSDAAAMMSRFKGAVFSGELRESLNMIKSPASSLRRGIPRFLSTVVRRGRRARSVRDLSKVMGDTWLEYAFGWSPLIKDIDTAITQFYNSDRVRAVFEMVRGSAKEVYIAPVTVTNLDVGAGYRFLYGEQKKEEVHVAYYGVVRSYGNGVNNNHRYGFNPVEFVPTVWELIPYSFLVDYFSNIGDILTSWSYRWIAPPWTARTIRRTFTAEALKPEMVWVENDAVYLHGIDSFVPGSAKLEYKSFVRTPDVPLHLPSLELQVPGNWRQWTNLSALAVSKNAAQRSLIEHRKRLKNA